MAARAFAFVAALCLTMATACSPSHGAQHPAANPLDADWLDGKGAIDAPHLARIVAMGTRDVWVRPLFDEALARLGNGRIEILAQRFSTCAANVTTEAGLTLVKASDALVSRSIEEIAFGTRAPDAEQQLAELEHVPAREVRVSVEPDFVVVERTLLPEICILARLSIAQAYEAIVHELVHALHTDPRARHDLALTAIDDMAFRRAMVLGPGGEVEAYSASVRARSRVDGGRYLATPLGPLFAFNADAATVADCILAPRPQGLGYAEGLLRDALRQARLELVDRLAKRRAIVEHVIDERRTNIEHATHNLEAHTHNLEAHRHNLGIANARGDRTLADRSRAGIDEAEAGLTRTRAFLDAAQASEARLSAELPALSAQLAQARALVEGPEPTSQPAPAAATPAGFQ